MKHAAHSSINPNLSEVTLSTKPSIIYTFAHFLNRVLIGGDVTANSLILRLGHWSLVIFVDLQAFSFMPAGVQKSSAIPFLSHQKKLLLVQVWSDQRVKLVHVAT